MKIFAALIVCLASMVSLGQPIPLKIGEAHTIRSLVLSEDRTLNIYLPPSYNSSDTQKYPVIFLLDGGMDEDFIHIVGLVQFNSFPWVDRLPESIVVGIVNKDRKHDFTFPTSRAGDKKLVPTGGGSGKFISFLEGEVIPYVQSKVRTRGTKTIIGESLGGLLAAEILFTKPALFNKYIIISPSLWWDDGSLLTRTAAPVVSGLVQVYVGVGKEGKTPGDHPHVMEKDARKLADKIKASPGGHINVHMDYLPDETHATIGHHAVFNAFRWLSGK